jgi:putative oxidoreductase
MKGTLPKPTSDVVLLIARVLLGVVLFAHGWQKLLIYGIAQVHQQFETLGIPLAIISSSFVTFVEFVGGALLIVGTLTPVVCLLHMIVMIGAASFVHVSNGIFVGDGGWELVGVIACCELLLATHGAGRYSVDWLVRTRMNTRIPPTAPRPAPVEKKASSRHTVGRDPNSDPESATTAILVQASSSSKPAIPDFGEQPTGTGSFPEQLGGVRPRRIPRPVAPLQGRVPRRTDPSLLDVPDPGER